LLPQFTYTVTLLRDSDEVLEKLATSFALHGEGELDGSVEEVCYFFDVGFGEGAGCQSGGAETDSTWYLGVGFWKRCPLDFGI
jgi:hypothetical protein